MIWNAIIFNGTESEVGAIAQGFQNWVMELLDTKTSLKKWKDSEKGTLHCLTILRHPWSTLVLSQPWCPSSKSNILYHRRPKIIDSKFRLLQNLSTVLLKWSSSIDNISSPDVHPLQCAPPGLIEGVQTPEMIIRHFQNTLYYTKVVNTQRIHFHIFSAYLYPTWVSTISTRF